MQEKYANQENETADVKRENEKLKKKVQEQQKEIIGLQTSIKEAEQMHKVELYKIMPRVNQVNQIQANN